MTTQMQRLTSRRERTQARLFEHAARNGLCVTDLANVRLPWFEVRSLSEREAATAGAELGSEFDDSAEIFIFDEIGGSFGVDANNFVDALNSITASSIRLRINSPGGSVFEALTIANALRHHPARVNAYVDGIAASAASFIATSADELTMMPGSQLMIHDASAMGDGNSAEMAQMATFLDRQSDNIADLYAMKAGGDRAKWRELMQAETWLFADEAVELGLADRAHRDHRADPDPDVAERMARSFDLNQFRYAGRENAPAPGSRTRGGRATTHQRAQGATMATATVTDLASAAKARAAALSAGDAAQMRSLPLGTGPGRLRPAAAKLRAQLSERNGQQLYRLDGIASVTDRRYRMWDTFGEYDEVVTRPAFDATLAANPDVAFLLNHKGMTMARTQAGTLELSMAEQGLRSVAWLNPKRQDVQDLVIAIEDGHITEMSFAFMLENGEWSDDFSEFRITQLSIDRGDVSAVNYGANPYTSIAARSAEIMADLDHLPAGMARAAMDRLTARSDMPAQGGHTVTGNTVVQTNADGSITVTAGPPPVAPEAAKPESVPLADNGANIAFYEAILDLS